uniref:Sulfotransferase n=1 Tax=Caulobacter sp. (strain K31) TaxID=366602 RepID=B0T7Q2_CAUSK
MSVMEADRPILAAEPGASSDAACACGSGLGLSLCCQLDLTKANREPVSPDFASTLSRMADAYRDRELVLAEHMAHAALREAPAHRDALGGLYNVCKDTGRIAAAEALVRRMAKLYPDDPMVRMNAALFFRGKGAKGEAEAHGRALVRLAPTASAAHVTMGLVFNVTNQFVSAEHHLRRALDLGGPADAETLGALAIALRGQGRLDLARDAFAQAVAVATREAPHLLIAWADLEEAASRFDASETLLDRAQALAPRDPRIALGRATLSRRRQAFQEALDTLDALEARGPKDQVAALAMKERGLVFDALGRHDEAFLAFTSFKQRHGAWTGHVYAADHAALQAAWLKDFFTAERTPHLLRAGPRTDLPQPIFVVGFPRSGTTLVEQTLTSHPAISAGDELPIINRLIERLPSLLGSLGAYPGALTELWVGDRAGMIDSLRDIYLNEAIRLGATRPGAAWFTDKMPLNETHLGLIHLLFPQSPIVQLVRHPMDVVLSVFSNGLSHGFHCATSLESAARHFALTADLVEHYKTVLPMRHLDVRYEDMVRDQEAQVRRLFDFIGEPYDPRVLDFHENRRPARTASYAQVTEKLYDRSMFRFRDYRSHLTPVEPILRPWIEKLGYGAEAD